ncbi:putative flavoprotein [Fennellomyces sp. T-0311]|nr:putative flavoprotein [Fennellomyces sp. T-0311]
MPQNKKQLDVAIIGTGFSGICSAIQLEQQIGIKAQLFEISPDVGGIWEASTFPGLECDIASHIYSLSFEPNPAWTQRHSSQREIYAYLQDVARKHNLYDRIKFNAEVFSAEWKEDQSKWFLQWRNPRDTQQPIESGYYDAVVSALGPLRLPNIPHQFKKFDGPVVHTARWDSTIDYTNKRIAIIGSGASAAQVLAQLQKVAGHVYSYQRTPAWCAVRCQYTYSETIKWIFQYIPLIMRFYRWFQYVSCELYFSYFGSRRMAEVLKKHLAKSMAKRLTAAGRPDLIPILTPDYLPGCKRIAFSETYLEALAQPNVTVIPTAASEVRGRTIIDKDGNETEVDILILATGYDLVNPFGNLQIYGRNNIALGSIWGKEGPKAYKTVTVHGFPNFFMMLGPGAAGLHISAVTIIEIVGNYIAKCIKHLARTNAAAIEPKKAPQDTFFEMNQKRLENTVWKFGGCQSWYIAGNGVIYGLWHGTTTSFWWHLRSPDFGDFIEYVAKDAPNGTVAK